MSFSMMFDILKKKEKNKIVFVQCGHFYLAIGEDAVLLHERLELKCTCLKKQICKVGVPVNSIKKYIDVLDSLGYSYVIYDYNKINKELIRKYDKEGKYHYLTDKNLNCLLCKGISIYKEDEYLEAVTKLLEKENCYNHVIHEETDDEEK